MKLIFAALLGTGFAMLALDAVWLTFMSENFYRPRLGNLLAPSFKIAPALAFYAIYLVGVTRFAVLPALREGGWERAALDGALFGLVAYATYDLTNQATLREWSSTVTIVDLLWGSFLTSVAALVGYSCASFWR
jgi:uncharacterized membrane protein